MKTINDAEEMLRTGGLAPRDLAELKTKLAADYSFLLGQLEDILGRKAPEWNKIREEVKSDKQAEKIWDALPDGINEMGLRLRAKRCERLMSAINSLLRLQEQEIKNLI